MSVFSITTSDSEVEITLKLLEFIILRRLDKQYCKLHFIGLLLSHILKFQNQLKYFVFILPPACDTSIVDFSLNILCFNKLAFCKWKNFISLKLNYSLKALWDLVDINYIEFIIFTNIKFCLKLAPNYKYTVKIFLENSDYFLKYVASWCSYWSTLYEMSYFVIYFFTVSVFWEIWMLEI